MDIKPYDKTIRDLLNSKRQFVIPRFQREYSWDKKNYKEFFEDKQGQERSLRCGRTGFMYSLLER